MCAPWVIIARKAPNTLRIAPLELIIHTHRKVYLLIARIAQLESIAQEVLPLTLMV